MDLIILRDGTVRAIYGEDIDLGALGRLSIRRASHVEPDGQGCWVADLTPISGPVLGPFSLRSQALNEERAWLVASWLFKPA